MPNDKLIRPFKLDPWTASSLLQKAIRRGEVELAKHAARTLYRQRGRGMWRRLIGIAFEDVGIAAPELVSEVARLATDKNLRDCSRRGHRLDPRSDGRLADAPKDRSADYLYCSAIKLPDQRRELVALAGVGLDERIAIAADLGQPLLRRAVATLASTTTNSEGMEVALNGAIPRLVASLEWECASPLHHAAGLVAKKGTHPITLMVPLLWCAFSREDILPAVTSDPMPVVEWIGGVPLYTFDQHTSTGKQAVSVFAKENCEVRDILAEHVPDFAARDVALVAAFYCDGMPVLRRLDWGQSRSLETLGIEADMVGAGCPREGIGPIVDCVRRNLDHLNEVRRRIVSRRAAQ